MPGAGALDAMEDALHGTEARRVTLCGCPSACLLPLLWLRTIWFTAGGPELVIEWDEVQAPGAGEEGRVAAARLACHFADRIACAEPQRAWSCFGVRCDAPADAGAEAFDLLASLVDLWDSDLHHHRASGDWCDAVRGALVRCAAMGHRRVAIYGAGTHTRSVGDALLEPPVEILGLIDDDVRRHGQRLWGYPILGREEALALGVDAVVISANSIEELLWERAAVFRAQGVATLRLYGAGGESGLRREPVPMSMNPEERC